MTPIRYSGQAMALHWAIALLLVYNFALGQRSEDLPRGPELFALFQFHKSIGITVLLLSLWRLWIRLRTPRPAPVADAPLAEMLSSAVHWGFYAVMIAIPVSGWVIVSTSETRIPTLLFGAIPWPHLPLAGEALHEAAEEAHDVMAKLMLVLLALHLAGVIRHQFVVKDALVERMVPASRAGAGIVAALVATLIASMALGRAGPLPGMPSAAPPPRAAPAANPGQAAAPAPEQAAKAQAPVENATPQDQSEQAATGPVAAWRIAPGARLGFAATVSGDTVNGRFERWSADIRFDPDRLAESSIRADIDLASVASGDGERDSMLTGADFFAVAAHPRARFVSRDIRHKGGDRYEARGTLSIKGVSHPSRLDFTLRIDGDRASASGRAALDRRRYGVGEGQFADTGTIGADVSVTIALTARRAART
jgi:cytochrome b561/polyisoprenoid-binding protein YceI